jgi:hypothetical protein
MDGLGLERHWYLDSVSIRYCLPEYIPKPRTVKQASGLDLIPLVSV